jgi:hypothetical protein
MNNNDNNIKNQLGFIKEEDLEITKPLKTIFDAHP